MVTTKKLLLKLRLHGVRPKLATTTRKLLKLSILRVLPKWTTTPTSRTGGIRILGKLTTRTTTWPLPMHTRGKGRATKSTTQVCPHQATLTTFFFTVIPTGSGAPRRISGARPQGRMRSGDHLINEDTVAVNERRLYLLTPACAC